MLPSTSTSTAATAFRRSAAPRSSVSASTYWSFSAAACAARAAAEPASKTGGASSPAPGSVTFPLAASSADAAVPSARFTITLMRFTGPS